MSYRGMAWHSMPCTPGDESMREMFRLKIALRKAEEGAPLGWACHRIHVHKTVHNKDSVQIIRIFAALYVQSVLIIY